MTKTGAGFRGKLGRWFATGFLALAVSGINGCEELQWEGSPPQDLASRGEIRVLTIEHPLIYGRTGRPTGAGLEADLLRRFADSQGYRIRFIVRKNSTEAWNSLQRGEGDLVAARLRKTNEVDNALMTPAFESTHLGLFCRRKFQPESLADLSTLRVVIRASDTFDMLDVKLRQLAPGVRLELVRHDRALPLFLRVHRGQADCAIAENLEGAWLTRRFLSIQKVLRLNREFTLAWALPKERNDLHQHLSLWLRQAGRNGTIERTQHRYHSAFSGLDEHDVRLFLRRLETTLPKFEKAFRAAGREHGIDWRLIAAVAYQESHWNPLARSYTGVRGLMQLTLATAREVGVDDRLDPVQSIHGGAAYLRFLRNRVPARIENAEAWALALAAYNCGWGHLQDARALAAQRGLNPSSWKHLRKTLPLLEDPELASELTFGPARGRETVQFVERVRGFYQLWQLL